MTGNHGKRTALSLLLLITSASGISLPEKYEPLVRPNNGGVADVVNVSMNIISIGDVDEDKQKITVDFLLRTFWVDKRLADLVERETVFANKVPDIWTPHMSIANSAKPPARTDKSLILKPDGSLDYTERFSVQLNCPMSLFRYPFGQQICKIELNSNGYTTIHMALIWNGLIAQNIPTYNPDYSIYKIDQTSERHKTIFGEYSYITVDIILSRFPLGLIARAMLPCFVFAILSFVVTFYMQFHTQQPKVEDEDQDSKFTSALNSKLSFYIFKIVMNGFMLLIVVIVRQINFLKTPRSNTPTALDIWTGFMSAVILLCFIMSIQISFEEWKRTVEGDDSTGNRGKFTKKTFTILRVSIPILFLLFFIAFMAVCLS